MSSPNFDLIAPFYDALATLVFGKAIRKSQAHYLDLIPNQARVLILGGGTGWILLEISNQSLHIDYLDQSEKMLSKAKQRKALFSAIRFIQGNEDTIAGQSYDVVITPFVLDVCNDTQLPMMVEKIKRAIHKNGHWLCIDFNCYDTSLKARCLDILMRYFFRITTGLKLNALLPYFEAIKQTDFKEISSTSFYGNFIQATWFQKNE